MNKLIKNSAILLITAFLSPYFYLKAYLPAKKKNKNKKILIIDNSKIGDIVCITPALRAIKEKYPDCYLSVLATSRTKDILKNNKRVDEILIIERYGLKTFIGLIKKITKRRFDISINMVPGTLNFIIPFAAGIPKRITTISEGGGLFYNILSFLCSCRLIFKKNTLSIKHYLELLKFIGIANDNLRKEVYISDDSVEKADNFLKNNGINQGDILAGMCLSAGNKIKEWGAENFSKLADLIINKYKFKIIITGSSADKELLEEARKLTDNKIITTYDFSLEDVPALLKRFNFFISVDTGPLYIANALGAPVLDILGPCSPCDQPPVYEKCEIVYVKNLPCWPCSTVMRPAKVCKAGHKKCLKEISPEMALNSFNKLVEKYGR